MFFHNFNTIIVDLLLVFYLVIRISYGKNKEIENSKNLKRYLFGVGILILVTSSSGYSFMVSFFNFLE